MLTILPESPLHPDLGLLMERHHQAMHADSPPESIHMLSAERLAEPGIRFFVLRDDGRPVGMGAWKALTPDHAEIKSMHILTEERGRGLARQLMEYLVDQARAAGFKRLSLETGAQDSFAPARALYVRGGFIECEAFPPYKPDPNSTFMTMAL
ncbi:GNAT family N-acetyltransferase [Falsirhodobacter sp. 20TX0035]|uniref:GNAT family N-acetyltransferase n=1 Tax=Falsirhodobacter sp. 20TX0035 TaxID=3022019 RepID=UPI00232B03F3|nr:GNAT family N-acetyltransferase [Falsirhodobacter sp. 20TX0035]MDB6453378.1 GNAT family N-acetyltransferase [Falsirhodobacter sp. 20TX0035]